ncbi:DUF4340 domain-containing protein [Rhodovibrio salinarum]|uniref:DUF4340 domain-containing protein n=1 Tax=Rhodovibrio salinarum TaxID=1087 RepID=A0A934QLX1_9PROT|nr:DUF4340 domain-containing protein [Rhodovibrio salinarum]MBK1699077.1 DUF4340 domain-containing protein [Rhodovibrio salinarum]
MSLRTLIVLALITLLAGGGALTLAALAPRPAQVQLAGEPVLPGLAARLSEVHRVAVEVRDKPGVVLTREDDGWAVASAHGYPARTERVNRLLVGLANLEKIAPKTADPGRFQRLAVGDPADDPLARRVTLTGRDGQEIAQLIVGKQRHELTGRAANGTYVRVPGEERAWLAAGLADLSDDAYPFLDTAVIDLPAGQIRRIEIARVGGGRLVAVRPSENAPALAIADVPQGRQLDVAAVRRLGALLSEIKFDRVEPANALTDATRVAATTVFTFDGLRLAVRVFDRDGRFWLTLSASADTPAAQDRANRLNARVDGWAYMVADYIAERLTRTQADVLAK